MNTINTNLDVCNGWTKAGNDVYNTNLGKVGVGTANATGKLELYKIKWRDDGSQRNRTMTEEQEH